MPTPTPRLDSQAQPLLDERYLRTRYTYPFNFSYSPTLTQPCGFTKENVPIALQLVGRHFEEELLLRAGHAFERATEWHTRLPPALL